MSYFLRSISAPKECHIKAKDNMVKVDDLCILNDDNQNSAAGMAWAIVL